MNNMLKYYQLTKVEDVTADDGTVTHVMYGLSTAQTPDKDNEQCVYADIVPQYKKWSQEALDSTSAAGQERSLGNLRLMHSLVVAGKVTGIDFDDANKRIFLKSEPKDEVIWQQVLKGMYRGYSQAGNYLYRRCSVCAEDIKAAGNFCPKCKKEQTINYSASLAEVSLVDSPCLKEAVFSYVKANGSHELVKFAKGAEVIPAVAEVVPAVTEPKVIPVSSQVVRVTKRRSGEDLVAGDFLVVGDAKDPDTWNLPWRFSTEAKTRAHLASAVRVFEDVDAPEAAKAAARSRLNRLTRQYGIEVSDPNADKSATNKGETTMSDNLLKAAGTNLASHFKKAAKDHEIQAKAFAALAEDNDEAAEEHGQMAESYKAVKDDPSGTCKAACGMHKSMQRMHKSVAATYTKCAKSATAMSEACGKMADDHDADDKAAAAEPVTTKATPVVAVAPAVVTPVVTAPAVKTEVPAVKVEAAPVTPAVAAVPATPAVAEPSATVKELVAKAAKAKFDEMVNAEFERLMNSTLEPTAVKAAGPQIVPRTGQEVDQPVTTSGDELGF